MINVKLDKYGKYLNNKYLKIIIPIMVIIIFVVALIGAFTFLKPQDPAKLFNDTQKKKSDIPFEKRPGITNVKTFADAYKNKRNASLDKGNASGNTSEGDISPRPTRTPKPLPYPRIEINYTSESVTTIGNESAGDGYKFLIVKMDIRNYGYKYFDAHPTKFAISRGNALIEPTVNVSTTNIIDAVIPNNSRAKGDIIFLLKSRQTVSISKKMKYTSGNYKILFNSVSSTEDEIVEDEGDDEEEKSADQCYDYDYQEGKCYD